MYIAKVEGIFEVVNKLFYVLAICVFSNVIACEKLINDKLDEKYQQWQALNLNSYSYVMNKQCFCSPEYTRETKVSVIDGNVVGAVYVDSNEKVPENVVADLVTISGWFENISSAIDKKSDIVKVLYHEQMAYPVKIEIDKHKRRSDDEFVVLISNLKKQ